MKAEHPLLQIEDIEYRRGAGDQCFMVRLPKLTLHPGELVAVTGRSGSGKSTLLELLGLLTAPHTGTFNWRNGEYSADILQLWQRDHNALANIRATSMGFVLQTGGLLPYLSIQQNLGLVRRLLGLPKKDPHLDELIDCLEIGALLHKKPKALSVGEQQRAAIVRALAHRPALLLLDEPTSALDADLADKVLAVLLEQVNNQGIAAVLATHEQQRVENMGLRRLNAVALSLASGYGATFIEKSEDDANLNQHPA